MRVRSSLIKVERDFPRSSMAIMVLPFGPFHQPQHWVRRCLDDFFSEMKSKTCSSCKISDRSMASCWLEFLSPHERGVRISAPSSQGEPNDELAGCTHELSIPRTV